MTELSPVCIKRLKGDYKLLQKDPLELAHAVQDPENPLIWYFVLKGPKDSHYEGGYYLGRVEHSPEYPFKPPNFYMMTPSGRFHLECKICLSNSDYHQEEWTAMWNMRNLLIGFLSIFLSDSKETIGIGRIVDTEENRRKFAQNSISFNETKYKYIWDMFTDFVNKSKD